MDIQVSQDKTTDMDCFLNPTSDTVSLLKQAPLIQQSVGADVIFLNELSIPVGRDVILEASTLAMNRVFYATLGFSTSIIWAKVVLEDDNTPTPNRSELWFMTGKANNNRIAVYTTSSTKKVTLSLSGQKNSEMSITAIYGAANLI